jgi:hypothetical protein
MISASNATDATIIEAFAGIPALLDQTPALIAQDRLPDCECLLGPVSLQAGQAGRVQGNLYFHRVDGDLRGGVERIDTKVCPPLGRRSYRICFGPNCAGIVPDVAGRS